MVFAFGTFTLTFAIPILAEYWTRLDQEIREYTAREGMLYLRDDDRHRAPFGEPPVVRNYFYHEEVRKSAKKQKV